MTATFDEVKVEAVPVKNITFDEVKIREPQTDSQHYKNTMESIRRQGVQLSILVQPRLDESGAPMFDGDGKPLYSGIDGCQRHSICDTLGLETIPARIIDNISDDDVQVLQLTLNKNRVPQTKKQERDCIKQFMSRNPELTQGQVASAFSMHQSELSNILGLDRLTPEALDLYYSDDIVTSNAFVLSRIDPDFQNRYLEDAQEMAVGDFIEHMATEKKKIKEEKSGGDPSKILKVVMRKRPWFEEKHEELTQLVKTTSEEDDNYMFIAGQLEFCKQALSIDAASIKEAEEAREAAREKKKKKDAKVSALEEAKNSLEDENAALKARLAALEG